MREEQTALPSALGAANARNIGRMLFRGAYNLEVYGADLMPRHGRLIVAANHLGFLDGALLCSSSPRPIHLLAKSEMFVPPMDKLMIGTGQIPVDYESPDRDAIDRAMAVLSAERALGIFPEAHRGVGDVSRIRHGVAYLATRSRAPIVPVALLGTRLTGMTKNSLPPLRSRMVVVFGAPFTPDAPGDLDTRSALASVGEGIRQRLSDHVRDALASTGMQLPDDDTSLETIANLQSGVRP
ncbi:MAG: lysophospholipid acyltransferase family protein [Actinomycetes bacterium]